MANKSLGSEPFFYYMSIVLLALTILGFGGIALVNPNRINSASWIVMVHGLIMITWYSLIIFQAKLVRGNNIKLHMKLGLYSLILGILIVITGFATMASAFKSIDESIDAFSFNAVVLINFSILFGLALYKRSTPRYHKRFIIFSGIVTLFPALFRITIVFKLALPFTLLFWLILITAIFIYDIKSIKRVHWASIVGVILVFCNVAIGAFLASYEPWRSWIDMLLS